MFLVVVVVGLLLMATAAPAFAFIHAFVPAGYCPQPASVDAADNDTATGNLPRVPIAHPPAPETCPAP